MTSVSDVRAWFMDRIKEMQSSDVFRINAYAQVVRTLNSYFQPSDIITKAAIDKLPLTDHMKEKINNLSSVADIKSSDVVDIVGNSKAKIPRAYIAKLEPTLTKFPKSRLVGSYSRGAPFSKDIDVLVISDNKDILKKYADFLQRSIDIIVQSHGQDKMSLLVPKSGVKIDVFRSPTAEKHSMLLHFTGPKEFNIHVRAAAKKKGYLLNQHGLFKDGHRINKPGDDECRILKYIDMTCPPPHERR